MYTKKLQHKNSAWQHDIKGNWKYITSSTLILLVTLSKWKFNKSCVSVRACLWNYWLRLYLQKHRHLSGDWRWKCYRNHLYGVTLLSDCLWARILFNHLGEGEFRKKKKMMSEADVCTAINMIQCWLLNKDPGGKKLEQELTRKQSIR